jgi:mannose-6-phosphate isomerase-like protein (cupin superfamily)
MSVRIVRALSLLLFAAGVTAWAQGREQNRVAYWNAADLHKSEVNELVPQAKKAASGVGAKTYLDLSTHKVLVSHREKPGVPELHKAETDVFVVQSGGGILQVGGDIVDRKDNASGATGSSIRGGEKYKMGVGDVINIPPNVPHNWLLAPGESVTYLVVKAEEPRP